LLRPVDWLAIRQFKRSLGHCLVLLYIEYTVSGKKRPELFLHNFKKCRQSFVIFGTKHSEDSFY